MGSGHSLQAACQGLIKILRCETARLLKISLTSRSALGEFLDKGAGIRQLHFIIGGGRRIAAITRCHESGLGLLDRQLRHLRIAAQLGPTAAVGGHFEAGEKLIELVL